MVSLEGNPSHNRAITAVAIMAGALVCALVVTTERGFPYWDFVAYHDEALAAADSLRGFFSNGDAPTIPLITLPVIPWVLLFGDSRVVYILGVYFSFFVPYLLMVAAIARRVWPDRASQAAMCAVAAVLLTPAAWSHVLQGYPDIVGAALMTGCVLLYGRHASRGGMFLPVAIGVLAGLSVVLRRHYVFAIVALYAGMVVDAMVSAVLSRRTGPTRTPIWRPMLALGGSGASVVLVIALLNPQFFAMALNSHAEMVPYQMSVSDTFDVIVRTVGILPMLLAFVGWLWLWRRGALRFPEFRVVILATLAWVVVWAGYARQASYHYPHWMPLFVALGLAWLWLELSRPGRGWLPRVGLLASGLLVATGWLLCMPVLAFEIAVTPPDRMFADRMERVENPAYGTIIELVDYLRGVATPDDPILVAASSSTLNFDILRTAESGLYGRDDARLQVMVSPQADSQTVPTDLFLKAKFVVVADPFQHHLAEEDQKVVRVLVDAFRDGWPIAKDFDALPHVFQLPDDAGQIRVYRRRQASAPNVALDTAHRIEAAVLGQANAGGLWVAQSRYNTEVTRNEDGTFHVTAHPARASDEIQTVLTLAGLPFQTGDLSATVWFYDTRCAGIQIVARLGEGGGANEHPIGSFSPKANDAPLSIHLVNARAGVLSLRIGSSPETPEDINSCTIMLKNLKATPAR